MMLQPNKLFRSKWMVLLLFLFILIIGGLVGYLCPPKRDPNTVDTTITVFHQYGDQSVGNDFTVDAFSGSFINGVATWNGSSPDVYGVVSIDDKNQYTWTLVNNSQKIYSYGDSSCRYFYLKDDNTWEEINWKEGRFFDEGNRNIRPYSQGEPFPFLDFYYDASSNATNTNTLSPGVYRMMAFINESSLGAAAVPEMNGEWWCISIDIEIH